MRQNDRAVNELDRLHGEEAGLENKAAPRLVQELLKSRSTAAERHPGEEEASHKHYKYHSVAAHLDKRLLKQQVQNNRPGMQKTRGAMLSYVPQPQRGHGLGQEEMQGGDRPLEMAGMPHGVAAEANKARDLAGQGERAEAPAYQAQQKADRLAVN